MSIENVSDPVKLVDNNAPMEGYQNQPGPG